MSIWGTGLQGILDRGMGSLIGGIFKGVGGFVTGLGRGVGRQASNAYSKSGVGKITSMLGHGIGKIASLPIMGVGFGVGAIGKSIFKSMPGDYEWAKRTGSSIFRSISREVPKEMAKYGFTGIGGRMIKPGAAWGITVSAIALGGAKGVKDSDYNIGVKYAVNGIMDTEGVGLTPGTIGASYTPITSRKPNNGLRDLGTNGNLGFALHNQRNTGQIRR